MPKFESKITHHTKTQEEFKLNEIKTVNRYQQQDNRNVKIK